MDVISWHWQVIAGFVFNLFVTGIFAFSVFSLPVEQLFPKTYYRIRQPEKLKKFSRSMGIETFRRFLLATVWRDKQKQKEYFDGTTSGLNVFETNTKKSEFGHILPFVVLLVISLNLFFQGKWIMGLSTMIINIIFNFYPVILQRLHRVRLERMRKILRRKNN